MRYASISMMAMGSPTPIILNERCEPFQWGKNWLFAWTEIGAEHIGIIQSLIVTCRLHDVNLYDYLVDVLQRIDRHSANDTISLTPRVWKEKLADNPLRSDVFKKGNDVLE